MITLGSLSVDALVTLPILRIVVVSESGRNGVDAGRRNIRRQHFRHRCFILQASLFEEMSLPNSGLLEHLPGELHAIVQEYLSAFDRAVTAPYAAEEVAWLVKNVPRFCLFSSSQDDKRCDAAPREGGGWIPLERVHRHCSDTPPTVKAYGVLPYGSQFHGKPPVCMRPEGLSQQLVGRHGPEISREHVWHAVGYGTTVSTTVLLDVHVYFAMVRRRLQMLGHARPAKEAQRRTVDYLTAIARFYRGRPGLLELYLASSVYLHAEKGSRRVKDACGHDCTNDSASFTRQSNNCAKYCEALLTMIAAMHT